MPHLVIELTENTRLNCSQEELLDETNAALLASGQFEEADIKSRCVTLNVYRQGTDVRSDRAFVHATLSVLDGRDQATRRQLGQIVCDALSEAVRTGEGQSVQVSVNVVEMERATYAKTIIGA